MKRKKILPVLPGIMLVLLVFTTQCRAPQLFTAPAPAPITLRMASFDPETEFGQAEARLIEQFQTAHPHLQFAQLSPNELNEDPLTSAAPPDLVAVLPNSYVVEAMNNRQVIDLTEVWQQSGLAEKQPAGLQALSMQDGKQYYLPLLYGWTAIYYNKALFARYNLAPPQTWEEFLAVCDTLLANGVTPLALSNETGTGLMWFEYLNLRINGAAFHHELLRGQISYEDERVRDVLETWRMLFANGYFWETRYRYDDRNSLNTVLQGHTGNAQLPQFAMILSDSWLVSELPADAQAELDFFPFPVIDPAVPVAEALISLGYVVPANAAHIPEAMAFLTHVASVEGQTLLAQYQAGGATYAPARLDVDPTVLTPTLRKAMNLAQTADELAPTLWTILPNELASIIDMGYDKFLEEPHELEKFILKLEEARKWGVKKSLWLK